jgi:hypothetical protein
MKLDSSNFKTVYIFILFSISKKPSNKRTSSFEFETKENTVFYLSLLEFLFFSFLSPFSLIEFLREETPFVLPVLLLLLLFFVLLLLLLFLDGDLLLLDAAAAVAVFALGFSPAKTFCTASLVST